VLAAFYQSKSGDWRVAAGSGGGWSQADEGRSREIAADVVISLREMYFRSRSERTTIFWAKLPHYSASKAVEVAGNDAR